MFPALKIEILDRFSDLEAFYRASKRLHGTSSLTVKGLLFVQLYAIHEYTVRTTLEIALKEISDHRHRYAALRPSLLALFLESEVQSFSDSPAKSRWVKRMEIFKRAASNKVATLTASPFPTDDSHFRATHLKLILQVLGIQRSLTVRRRHVHYINEVVDHRNSIAHGGGDGCGYRKKIQPERHVETNSYDAEALSSIHDNCFRAL